MKEKIITLWKQNPLKAILLIGFILRLPAVNFSKGFGWHDDHFLIIEASQSWVEGLDYNNWFPWSGATEPDGHSLFYAGLHYVFFTFMHWIHLDDPQLKMFFVRLIHAVFSLLIIYYGYKIAGFYKGDLAAKVTGLLLACYWFMPFLSVRNLIEFVCVPFLVWGTWLAIPKDGQSAKKYFMAGFILALAVSVRYQSSMIAAGIVLALLLMREWKVSVLVIAGGIVSFVLLQAPFDYMIWKKPFAEFGEYVRYNMENSESYGSNTWYSYLIVILGMLIPPLSIFLFLGYLSTWKKYILIFLPSFIFLVFHSSFPNKQERFILTIVPFIIIGGVIGIMTLWEKYTWFTSHRQLLKGFAWFAIVINIILLPFISTMYSKKARVESMVYLSKYKNINIIVEDDCNRDNIKIPPEFYARQWMHVAEVHGQMPIDSLTLLVNSWADKDKPKFVLFFQSDNLPKRLKDMKAVFKDLTYETTIKPGFIDWLLTKMNPRNANEEIFIYKTNVVPYEENE